MRWRGQQEKGIKIDGLRGSDGDWIQHQHVQEELKQQQQKEIKPKVQ